MSSRDIDILDMNFFLANFCIFTFPYCQFVNSLQEDVQLIIMSHSCNVNVSHHIERSQGCVGM